MYVRAITTAALLLTAGLLAAAEPVPHGSTARSRPTAPQPVRPGQGWNSLADMQARQARLAAAQKARPSAGRIVRTQVAEPPAKPLPTDDLFPDVPAEGLKEPPDPLEEIPPADTTPDNAPDKAPVHPPQKSPGKPAGKKPAAEPTKPGTAPSTQPKRPRSDSAAPSRTAPAEAPRRAAPPETPPPERESTEPMPDAAPDPFEPTEPMPSEPERPTATPPGDLTEPPLPDVPAPPEEMPTELPRPKRKPAPSAPPRQLPSRPAPSAPSARPPRAMPTPAEPTPALPLDRPSRGPRDEAPAAEPLRPEPEVVDPGLDSAGEMFELESFDEVLDCCHPGECCSEGCCRFYDQGCPEGCGPFLPYGLWARVDYLMWWGRGASAPPLVTIDTPTGNGNLSSPTAQIIFGNQRFDNDIRSGGRINFGTWFDPQQSVGVGGGFVGLQQAVTHFNASSTGDPLLARPFFNAQTQSNDSIVLARNGVSDGFVIARTTNSYVSADAYYRKNLAVGPGRRDDLILGYQFARLNESIRISDRIRATDPNGGPPVGTTIDGNDLFRTRNEFHGAELGWQAEGRRWRWSWNSLARIAMGNMRETALINGDTVVVVPGDVPAVQEGALLTQPSNIGRYVQDRFAVIPEWNFSIGYQLTRRCSASIGYTFIYVSRVAQATRQIDTTVDPAQFTGGAGAFPGFHFQQNSYWLQGVNLGLNYKF